MLLYPLPYAPVKYTQAVERLIYLEEDHAHHGRTQTARLRVTLTAGSDTPRAARILAELQQHSPEFVRAWELQEVAQRYAESKTILHPRLGRIDIDGQALITDNRARTSSFSPPAPTRRATASWNSSPS